MAGTILIVDDEQDILQSLDGILTDEGYDCICVESGNKALDKIGETMPDLILLDIWMPGMDGLETLTKIKESYPNVQVVMMSGHGNIETAVKATKQGAYDFVEKPLSLEKLLLSIHNALEYYRLGEEITLLKTKEKDYDITGTSAAITELTEQIRIVSPTNAWVLISGENGTGKELVAHTIHRLSRRNHKPLVEVNCAAIPEDLIESELFGHEKGAFTGASAMRKGKFDVAHEGTIFLDEIGDMSLKAQSKTLRILQEQRFERVGGTKTIKVDVRVLAATNKDLEAEIEKGTFREDLYFRLNVIPVKVPPLRKRVEDIGLLVNAFLNEFSQSINVEEKEFSEEAIGILKKYNWPGNVRELKNLVERLVIMTQDRVIQAIHIPSPFNRSSDTRGDLDSVFKITGLKEAKNQFEKAFLEGKLKEYGGNISQTAEAIGIERSNLHKKIKAYGLNDFRP
ncbi:MAG: sigma-54 dependent transcriptional regulator [Desulfatiglans sp.]|jgi:two-component system nitrogen regulation response regulator NtrX|nr:sigma-54 dependent transcriptional regulator [Thermodesulfobacteriota bacterium]MEE4351614.1 sigma-54 dependent transcriptional regulator [Desulfatiglans sp.]